MKFKLDENIDARLGLQIQQRGHDVSSVREQNLHGIHDEALYRHCRNERRILVTLDKDFSNVLRFTPAGSSGLVVLRGHDNLFSTMERLIHTLVEALDKNQPAGQLWIVEPGRLRIHESFEND
ncbi:DUF5615 family PIN-like protein [Candidatus Acetothermia bacterium]|nr:DUF5615 family PIN-like protein [Candidatus Acetothermia bacterium]MBI3642587.1 DUF5615 family PIN-like protein [Candidatus Acetothermia bacterium]